MPKTVKMLLTMVTNAEKRRLFFIRKVLQVFMIFSPLINFVFSNENGKELSFATQLLLFLRFCFVNLRYADIRQTGSSLWECFKLSTRGFYRRLLSSKHISFHFFELCVLKVPLSIFSDLQRNKSHVATIPSY